MSELKVSVSGIRGIWGDSLDLQALLDYTSAFGAYILKNKGSKVLMGRDGRPTGKLISQYCGSILNGMGIDVIDCGIVPTPTVLFGVRDMGLDGGIIVTASHNPIEWNALKFVKKGGVFTGEDDVRQIKEYLEQQKISAKYDSVGDYQSDERTADAHIEKVLAGVDVEAIKNKNFSVVLDPVNSAGSLITEKMLNQLNCRLKLVNNEIDGTFHRGTEPTPANLKHMESIVTDFKADVGFAQDPDADRLVLVDEKGRVLNEEMTLALAVKNILNKKTGDMVINMSTSRMIEDIGAQFGVKVYRTKVGEANVVEGIQKYNAYVGGEGNGGVIFPAINTARDSLAGIAMILEMMVREGKPLSELADDLPKYSMKKEKFDFKGDLNKLYSDLKKEFSGAEYNELDGLRIDWEENGMPLWLHVRPSNTEPVVRVIGEAKDSALLDSAFTRAKALL